jgi:hypothetical protein
VAGEQLGICGSPHRQDEAVSGKAQLLQVAHDPQDTLRCLGVMAISAGRSRGRGLASVGSRPPPLIPAHQLHTCPIGCSDSSFFGHRPDQCDAAALAMSRLVAQRLPRVLPRSPPQCLPPRRPPLECLLQEEVTYYIFPIWIPLTLWEKCDPNRKVWDA